MKKTSYLLFLLPFILALKCEKDSRKTTHKDFDYSVEGLPDATTSGERTFAFLLDGNPWIANTNNFGQRSAFAGYSSNHKSYFVEAYSDEAKDALSVVAILIEKGKIVVKDNYIFPDSSSVYLNERSGGRYFHMDINRPYDMKIYKLDTVSKIIAGRFEFWYFSEKDSAYHHVTKGRFDLEID